MSRRGFVGLVLGGLMAASCAAPGLVRRDVALRHFASQPHCVQGPLELSLDMAGGRWSEGAELKVSSPGVLFGGYELLVDGQRDHLGDIGGSGSYDARLRIMRRTHPECVGTSTARAAGPKVPASAESAGRGGDGASLDPEVSVRNPKAEAAAPKLVEVGAHGRVPGDEETIAIPPRQYRKGQRLTLRVWFLVPVRARFRLARWVLRPEVSDADWDRLQAKLEAERQAEVSLRQRRARERQQREAEARVRAERAERAWEAGAPERARREAERLQREERAEAERRRVWAAGAPERARREAERLQREERAEAERKRVWEVGAPERARREAEARAREATEAQARRAREREAHLERLREADEHAQQVTHWVNVETQRREAWLPSCLARGESPAACLAEDCRALVARTAARRAQFMATWHSAKHEWADTERKLRWSLFSVRLEARQRLCPEANFYAPVVAATQPRPRPAPTPRLADLPAATLSPPTAVVHRASQPSGPPPAPRADPETPRPSPNARWLPGYWTWEADTWMWIAGEWSIPESDLPRTVVAQAPPPAPRIEASGRPPASRAIWATGHWMWQGTVYVWVPGAWRLPPANTVLWEAARWLGQGAGLFKFVPGGWRR